MKLKYILIVACSLFTLTGRADEGMWMLGNLNKQTRKAMKELDRRYCDAIAAHIATNSIKFIICLFGATV